MEDDGVVAIHIILHNTNLLSTRIDPKNQIFNASKADHGPHNDEEGQHLIARQPIKYSTKHACPPKA